MMMMSRKSRSRRLGGSHDDWNTWSQIFLKTDSNGFD